MTEDRIHEYLNELISEINWMVLKDEVDIALIQTYLISLLEGIKK